ncbi:MAG: DUF975 family protein, partial [Gammaproteobacteria bacterium]|nr:DUF975 family protein [Gammaproteobacteria bacterium]
YKTPDASLNTNTVSGSYGSLEKGVTGDYEFSVGGALSEAWEKTKGAKWNLNLAVFIYFLVSIVVMVVLQMAMRPLMPVQPDADPTLFISASIGQQLLMNLILMPLAMGLFILGLRRSLGAPIEATSIFGYYNKAFSLLLTIILMYIMLIIGYVLLVLPGIYLSVAYMLAMPLVVEKGLSPWQALEASRKAITKRWFSVFGFFIVLVIIMVISMIPLGLGLIWTGPMMMIAYGIMYRNMFGAEQETVN